MAKEKWTYFAALLFVTLACAPALAHLLALPNKIGLPKEAYFVVQDIYRGWSLLGVVVIGALLSTLALVVVVRDRPELRSGALTAFLCIVGTQIIFWSYTYPANVVTSNWTAVPPDWEQLRLEWEYSHAASAVLNLTAVVALIHSLLTRCYGRQEERASDHRLGGRAAWAAMRSDDLHR